MINALGYVVLVAALLAGAWFRPASAVAGAVLMFAYDQWGQVSIPWITARPVFGNILVAAIIGLALLRQKTPLVRAFARASAATWLTFALYFYAILSSMWAPVDADPFARWLPSVPYLFVIVLVTPWLLNSREDFRVAVTSVAAIGAGFALLFAFRGNWGGRGLVIPGSAFETNPLAIANCGAFTLMACVLGGSGRWAAKEALWRSAGALAAMIMIVRTGTRGELLGALAALVLTLPIRFKAASGKGFATILVIFAIGAIGLEYVFSHYLVEGLSGRWQSTNSAGAAMGRLEMGMRLLSVWAQSPLSIIFGLGNSAAFDPRILGFYPHNLLIEMLAEEGVVGIVLFGSLIVVSIQSTAQLVRHLRRESVGYMAFWPAIVIHCFFVAMKEGSLIGNVLLFMAFSCLGRASISFAGATSNPEEGRQLTGRLHTGRPLNLID